jgi:hypothetical protein
VGPLGDGIPLDEPGDDVVGVRVPEIGRRDGRDPLPGAVGPRQGVGREDDPRLGLGLTPEDEVAGGVVLDGRGGRGADPRDRRRRGGGVEELAARGAASIGHESKPFGPVAVVARRMRRG